MIPGTVALAVILQMGGWILRNCWLVKPSSMVVMNEFRACKQTEINLTQNKIITNSHKSIY